MSRSLALLKQSSTVLRQVLEDQPFHLQSPETAATESSFTHLQLPRSSSSSCSLHPQRNASDLSLAKPLAVAVPTERPGEKKCSLCSYRTFYISNLNRHIRGHSDDKPYACIYCPYRTKQHFNLQRHVATHFKEKKNSEDRPFHMNIL